MTKQSNNSLAGLVSFIFVFLLIAVSVWTISPVDNVRAAPDTWRTANPMSIGRTYHTAVLLQNGLVFVMGGSQGSTTYASTELYDPSTNTWQIGLPMSIPRAYHTATMMLDGRVLVVGGLGAGILTSVEIYDPTTNAWSSAASLGIARQGHTATLLPDGRVLVAGGMSTTG